ncbi:hypothetical protein DBV15_12205, partial [Temnothorax longispinosus]
PISPFHRLVLVYFYPYSIPRPTSRFQHLPLFLFVSQLHHLSPSANSSFTFSQFDPLPPHFSFSTLKITFLFLCSSSFLSPVPDHHFLFPVPLSPSSSLFLLPAFSSNLSTFLSNLLTFFSSFSLLSCSFLLPASFFSFNIFFTFSSSSSNLSFLLPTSFFSFAI